MKKILRVLFIIVFLTITYVVVKQYRKVHPPMDFSHPISSQVDPKYHSRNSLNTYYNLCFEVESLAQYFWFENLINILEENQHNPEALKARKNYLAKLHLLQSIESELVQSKGLKTQGYSNFDIQKIEQIGIRQFLQLEKEKRLEESLAVLAEKGTISRFVYFTQCQLNLFGYQIREDGIFDSETEQAVIKYQKSIQQFPTGMMDKYTYRKLVENL